MKTNYLFLSILILSLFTGCGSKNEDKNSPVGGTGHQHPGSLPQEVNGPPPATTQPPVGEIRLFHMVNDYRKHQGLKPLLYDARLAEVARQHSRNMANGGIAFGHGGQAQRFHQIKSTFTYFEGGEIVAMNQGHSQPIDQALRQWKTSPSHHQQLLYSWGEAEASQGYTGIGIAAGGEGDYYFTQIFVGGHKSR